MNQLHQQLISLSRIELHTLDLPQKNHFTSGIGIRTSRRTLIVKWIDVEGRIGYGECSCRPDPYYSAEYLDGAIILIKKFVIPFLKKEQTFQDVLNILKRIRGWNFTKAAVESAAFQLARQQSGYDIAADIKAKPIAQVPVGISLGIYQDKDEFYDVVQKAIEEGYQRLKFKISPKANTALFDHINPLLFDNNVHTGFDANGSFYHENLDQLGYFVNTYKTIIEQPLPPSRFDVYLAAKEMYPDLQVCADEEVKNMGDLVKLHQLKAIDQLNLKVGRVGGVSASIEILNYCYEHDISCWIGGMFETGIGRLLNLEFASYLPEAKAHDLSPSARYFLEDIIAPEVTMNKGFIDVKAMEDNCKVLPEVMEKLLVAKEVFSI